MDTNETVQEAQVVEQPAPTAVDVINAQQADLKKQLEAVKNDMASLQKQFEDKKIHGVRLEGAIQAGDILLKSLLPK